MCPYILINISGKLISISYGAFQNLKLIVIQLKSRIPIIVSLIKQQMNDPIQKVKRNPLFHKTNHYPQKVTLLEPPTYCMGGPKNPPNISQYYHQLGNATKKKEGVSRQAKFRDNLNIIREHNPLQLRNSHCGLDKHRNNSRIINSNGGQKISHSKRERKTDLKLKKNTKQNKQIHRIVRPHHRLKSKNFIDKENREPRSTFQFRDEKYIQFSRMGQTQAFDEQRQKCFNKYDNALLCHQNFMVNQNIVYKIKKRRKDMNQDLPFSNSFQLLSEISTHKNVKQVKVLTPAEQIAEFEKNNANLQSEVQSETLKQLFLKEKSYFMTENFNCYLERKQPNITWFKRAIVINWMMEVSESFGCRRQSLAIAVNILDRFLSLSEPIELQELQKIACASMCISNKVDGMVFNLKSLSQQTENITMKEIQFLEISILMKLQWKLNPPTTNMWSNRIALQWDMYLDHELQNLPTLIKENLALIKFKTQDTQGYNNYRTLMQYIDLALMDVHSLRYHSREIAASFIYLILNTRLQLYELTQIIEKFPVKSDYLLKDTDLNEFFSQFLLNSFAFTLQDLLPTVQFCSTFLVLPLCFKLPAVVEQNSEDFDITFETLCTFQSCNQSNLVALRKRDRQYD